MSERDTGGRAFPWCGDLNDMPTINLGMTLRDYIAAKAMHQFCAGARLPEGFDAREQFEMLAERAYELADAMLKERSK